MSDISSSGKSSTKTNSTSNLGHWKYRDRTEQYYNIIKFIQEHITDYESGLTINNIAISGTKSNPVLLKGMLNELVERDLLHYKANDKRLKQRNKSYNYVVKGWYSCTEKGRRFTKQYEQLANMVPNALLISSSSNQK